MDKRLFRNRFQRNVKGVLDLHVKRSALFQNEGIIRDIGKILFSGMEASLLLQNQKFDFSFSGSAGKEDKGLRFSYNNFGEKKVFEKKIIDIFKLFPRAYSNSELMKILKYMKQDDRHQTTIGLEWLTAMKYPRIKIYFEELFHCYSNAEIIGKIGNVCKILNMNAKQLTIGRDNDIGAFCVDFFAGKICDLKIYFLNREMPKKDIHRIMNTYNFPSRRSLLSSFMAGNTAEKRAFYYVSKRFTNDGELKSVKLYKIYEVSQISDFEYALKEIERFLKGNRLGILYNNILKLQSLCQRHMFRLYPVIMAVDSSPREEKISVYVSFK